MVSEPQALFDRTMMFAGGVLGHLEDYKGQKIVRVGGSGVFITPSLFMTAAHVSRDLLRTDAGRFDELSRRREPYFHVPHSVSLFQVAGEPKARSIFWSVGRSWDVPVSDICIMEAVRDLGASTQKGVSPLAGFFEWALTPPPVGEQVMLFGFPQAEASTANGTLTIKGPCVGQQANVVQVYPERRDRGMFSFPGFVVDQPVEGGFSGGPVVWHDRLCGVVTGESFGTTYVASLWPLLLTGYQRPDEEPDGTIHTFKALFESGELRSNDWPAIEPRISWLRDDVGKVFGRIDGPA